MFKVMGQKAKTVKPPQAIRGHTMITLAEGKLFGYL
jgi:hypothetical protein